MKRRRIAYLSIDISNPYLSLLWPGAAAYAEKAGMDLVLMPGGQMNSPESRDRQESHIYEFLKSGRFDGFVIAANNFGVYNTPADLSRFCKAFSPLPFVSIGTKVEGGPVVTIDNTKGLKDLVAHFADVHGYRKFAYVRGPLGHAEADERYETFRKALSDRNIQFDESLLQVGDFNAPAGQEAGKRYLARKREIEAVLFANDIMALSCFHEMTEKGVRVPEDIAMGGFDDVADCAFISSPLSTVRQPLFELSYSAAEILSRRMDGESPRDLVLSTEAVIRRSCRCLSRSIETVGTPRPEPNEAPAIRAVEVFGETAKAAESRLSDLSSRILRLAGRADDERTIISSLEEMMDALPEASNNQERWNEFLNRVYALYLKDAEGCADPATASLFQKLRIQIGEFMERRQASMRASSAQEFLKLQDSLQAISADFDYDKLISNIGSGLRSLGVGTYFLCLYTERKTRGAGDWEFPRSVRLMAACVDGKAEGGPAKEFSPREFVPEALLERCPAGIFVVHPLYFGQEHFGYALMRMGPRAGIVYESLRVQMSSSLQASLILIDQKRQEEALVARNARLQELTLPMIESIKSVSGLAAQRIRGIGELIQKNAEASAKLKSANEGAKRVVENARDMTGMISMIEDISVNINLLSINASIESARAGAQGKGFAVISGEIRKMAAGTAENAQKTAATLAKVMENIGHSSAQSAESVEAFSALSKEISDLSETFTEIAQRMVELERASADISSLMTA
jgi:DNA-binding LacI/PurR family transcriptional regulator